MGKLNSPVAPDTRGHLDALAASLDRAISDDSGVLVTTRGCPLIGYQLPLRLCASLRFDILDQVELGRAIILPAGWRRTHPPRIPWQPNPQPLNQ
eukprot:9383988-Pyramimonas_sp.AAC.2